MKKGFTLIEVMVVIVILGVLAAVGTPKLFNSIAKAKASEVPVAASGYVKLQDIYLAENSALGNWKTIGYIAPGNGSTENFCYSQGAITDEKISREGLSASLIGWGATNLVALNECGMRSWWSIEMTPSSQNSVSFNYNLSYEPCLAFTSNWQIGNTLIGDCANATQISASGSDDNNFTDKTDDGADGKTDNKTDNNTNTNTNTNTGNQSSDKQALDAARKAYTSCTHCSNEEKERLKEAWDNAKEKCQASYGNASCS